MVEKEQAFLQLQGEVQARRESIEGLAEMKEDRETDIEVSPRKRERARRGREA